MTPITKQKAPAEKVRRRKGISPWVPNQHGAWAMLISPAALGLIAGLVAWVRADGSPLALPVFLAVLVAWFFGYFAFFAFGLAVKARNPRRRARYLRPVYVYGAVSLVGIAVALLLQPQLLWWALPFAPLVVIAVGETVAGRSRSTLSGVSTTVASALLYPALVGVGSGSVGAAAWAGMIFLAAYFSGTIPFVKSMIRERNNPRYLTGSICYHVLAVFAVLGLVLLAPVGWAAAVLMVTTALLALVRAVYVPVAAHEGADWNARRLGMAEVPVLLVACAGVLATLF
ncbi:YwiC-like family protein [Corynebacterium marinum]|uniref:YwiC-like protein n=1 Tax=Corynebacterium marinum DSM 44953 TaxID=1224162 RepID=A0A0B6TXG8_9CORY|nr:YwiC-like family protein [Corynebacterium marinum]AJK69371.1 hypothetical protein B840_08880 [Corynebacterium marinum DSM 44953]GGO22002.1 hypothetical protein GCM10010980_23680 [Corynebacterium marinum]